MRNILLIAQGKTALSVVDRLLRDEHVLITRVRTAQEANALVTQSPVDAIVCAVDALDEPSRACLEFLEYLTDVPTVIVLANPLLPVRSLRINVSIVAIQDGVESVRIALHQQLRRIQQTEPEVAEPAEFEFSFVIPARPDRISRARAIAGGFVQRSLKLPEYEFLKLELVLEEALANAVYHGSLQIDSEQRTDPVLLAQLIDERTTTSPYCDRKVRIDLAINEIELRIIVADEGPGFDQKKMQAGLENDAPVRSSGRGLLLMQAFADTLTFSESGNEVHITKLCSSSSSDSESREPPPVTRRIKTVSLGTNR